MITKTLQPKTLELIHQYTDFSTGNVRISIPYFNNRRSGIRHGLRVLLGKGTPKDIYDEVTLVALREKIKLPELDASAFKKLLVDANIGIDCSGFAFHILNLESVTRKLGSMRSHLHFPLVSNMIGRIIVRYFRTVENAGVATFAHDTNSHHIELVDIAPGDIITMLNAPSADRIANHILVIHQVEYQNDTPTTLHYSHSIAWPSDGEYGHGVRQGSITITDLTKPITEQVWTEASDTRASNYTLERARASTTDTRRLNWF